MAEQSERMTEIVRYLEQGRTQEIARAAAEGGQHVHIHYHAAPPVEPQPVVQQPDLIAKAFPIFVVAIGGMVVVGGLAVIFVMIMQAIVTALIVCAVCACSVAVAARSLRASKVDSDMMRQRIKATEAPKRRK